jgi:hypothetical protein
MFAMAVKNKSRGTLLADTLLTLGPSFPKTLRHINRHGLPSDCGLWISPCHAIYTVGMRFPLDIVFLDSKGMVVKLLRSFPPNCYAESGPTSMSALELPCNRIAESCTELGDTLELDPT